MRGPNYNKINVRPVASLANIHKNYDFKTKNWPSSITLIS